MEVRSALPQRALAVAGLAVAVLAGCSPRDTRRYVFIDAGAHQGESYTAFQKCRMFPEHRWEIFAIEANPHLIPHLPKAPSLTVINKAVWTENGTLEFQLESDDSGRNSVFETNFSERPVLRPLEVVKVESFDFDDWIAKNFTRDDYVILSLDVEGAEYGVLEKMMKSGTIERLDRLYVEMHWNVLEKEKGIIRARAEKESRQLLRRIELRGVVVGDDSVEDIMKRGTWADFVL